MSEESMIEPGSLVLILPRLEEDDEEQALTETLGLPVARLEAGEIGPELIEKLATARALVVDWDLGSRSGLDLVECLASDRRTQALPVAMASRHPTRPKVVAAMRAGARHFALRPCEPEELRERLGLAEPDAEQAEAAAADTESEEKTE